MNIKIHLPFYHTQEKCHWAMNKLTDALSGLYYLLEIIPKIKDQICSDPNWLKTTMIHAERMRINRDLNEKVLLGQGEYIVHYRNSKKSIPKDVYEKIYKTLTENSPLKIATTKYDNEESITKNSKERYHIILKEIQKNHSDLQITFVPRTLYELVFLNTVDSFD